MIHLQLPAFRKGQEGTLPEVSVHILRKFLDYEIVDEGILVYVLRINGRELLGPERSFESLEEGLGIGSLFGSRVLRVSEHHRSAVLRGPADRLVEALLYLEEYVSGVDVYVNPLL